MKHAVLFAEGAFVSAGGATELVDVTLETRGPHVVMAGDVRALVAVLSGAPRGAGPPTASARVSRGSLRLLGRDVARGEHRAVTGFALRDPPLPRGWKVAELLGWHARLGGAPRREARAIAVAALDRLGLTALADRKLEALAPLERRAAVLAAALVHRPEALVIEDPYAGLDEVAARELSLLVAQACAGRAALVALPALASSGPAAELIESASDLCLIRAGRLIAHAPPAQLFAGAQVYEMVVRRNAAELSRELADRGIELSGGPMCFVVRLPPHASASTVLAAAAEVGAPVIRCLPIL